MKVYDAEFMTELDPFTYYQTSKLDDFFADETQSFLRKTAGEQAAAIAKCVQSDPFASPCCSATDLQYSGCCDGLPPEADEGDFLWCTHKGEFIYVSAMQIDHLFNTLRMLFNHGVPPAFRVGDFTRHNDVFTWNREYKEEAFEALAIAVIEREDELNQEQKDELEDIRQNSITFALLLEQEDPADPMVGEPYDVD